MLKNCIARLAFGFGAALMAFPTDATAQITVMISGGFFLAYQEVLPEFERDTGIAVTTLSGASQGTGPKTIRAQLERGVHADVVILSREGLDELIAAGRVVSGSDTELARVPLAAAVRQGSPKSDISSVDALKRSLLDARMVSMPESTSGQFLKNVVFPKLGIADKVSLKIVPRGIDSTALLASGGSDLALGPVSELVNQPNVELVGPLPDDVQLVQVFTAAIVNASPHQEEAKRLTEFLASNRTTAAIRKSGMEPVGNIRMRWTLGQHGPTADGPLRPLYQSSARKRTDRNPLLPVARLAQASRPGTRSHLLSGFSHATSIAMVCQHLFFAVPKERRRERLHLGSAR